MPQEETECARNEQKKKCKDMLRHSGGIFRKERRGQGWEHEPVFEAFELYHVGNLSTEYRNDGQRCSHTPLEDKIVIICIILFYYTVIYIIYIYIIYAFLIYKFCVS